MKRFGTTFLLIAAALLLFPAFSRKVSAAGDVVRVGYFLSDGFQMIDESGSPYGYTYDYLQELSKYTNQTYEFCIGSVSECFSMLESGEIDMIGGVQMVDAYKRKYNYTTMPYGHAPDEIIVADNDSKFPTGELSEMEGMRVGLISDATRKQTLSQFFRDNGISVTPIYYNSDVELRLAYYSGIVDSVMISSLFAPEGTKALVRFSSNDFYFITADNNFMLRSKMDGGMEQLASYQPNFTNNLYNRYLSDIAKINPLLTEEESEYVSRSGTVNVVYNNDWAPLSYTNESGNFAGVFADVFRKIEEESGLNFNYIEVDGYSKALEMVSSGKADIICLAKNDFTWAAKNNLVLSKSYLNIPMVMVVSRSNKSGSEGISRVAMTSDFSMLDYLSRIGRDAKAVYCPSVADCLDSVKNEDVDAALINSYIAKELLSGYTYDTLTTVELPSCSEDISVAVNADADRNLVAVIDKALMSLEFDSLANSLLDHTVIGFPSTFVDMVYRFPLQFMAGVIFIFLTAIVFLLFLILNSKRYTKIIDSMVNTDELTGTWSFYKFKTECNERLDKMIYADYILFFINIQKFKYINEAHGHLTGDAILKHICLVANKSINHDECFARMNSDRFIIMMRYNDINRAKDKITTILDAVNESVRTNIVSISLAFSVGGYVVSEYDKDINIAIDRAQYAHDQCSTTKDTTIVMYSEELANKIRIEQQFESEMYSSLERGDFIAFFQPKVDNRSNRVYGAEALVRWQHPRLGLVPPGRFIPLFEKNGFVKELDFHIYERVCQFQSARIERRLPLFPISSNFSALHMLDDNFVTRLDEIAAKYGVPRRWLDIEITETVAINATGNITDSFNELRDRGFSISLDDFGTGYSSISVLNTLPVNIIKIDKSLIDSCDVSAENCEFLSGLMSLLHTTKKTIICEGVERVDQVELLKDMGCNLVQGYYYSKPLSADEFSKFALDHGVCEIGE